MALSTADGKLRVIYIAAPYRAPNAYGVHLNCIKAEAAAFQVWANGMVALCPHMNTRNFDGALKDEVWLKGDLELLRRCDAMLLTGAWQGSSGVKAEIAFAETHLIPIFTSLGTLMDWEKRLIAAAEKEVIPFG